ncbi:hypothetical protein [Lysobacter capsici]|uniref:hypothetical protein n=1 Tax=Lysobacter capsici TaxID=435897 RepID=UPI0012904066|nr:hypothetical protein [Lysobacter capsici]
MSESRPATIDDLGVTGAYYLAALLMANEQRLPVAATRRSTLAVLAELRNLHVIEVPWPAARWEIRHDAEETPIEHLQWSYAWPEYHRPGLMHVLCEYLESVTQDDFGLALRHRYWEALAVAEAERFFELQLAKHQFEAAWAQDFIFVHRDLQLALSIAQWRYCCWAATRQGASVALQQRVPALALVREAIYSELQQRAARLATGAWAACALPPSNSRPGNALGRVFATHLAKLGPEFWMLAPHIEHLLFRAKT